VDLPHNKARVHVYPPGKAQNISLRDEWVSLSNELHEFILRNAELGSGTVGNQFFFG
jgi:hypothetical protein